MRLQLLALVAKAGPGDKTAHSGRMGKVESKERKSGVGENMCYERRIANI